MNKQEIFDAVAIHLFKQGVQSRAEVGPCLYRTKEGLKCAVGALIPDELYDPSMDQGDDDGTGIGWLLRAYGDKLPKWFANNKMLLMELQDIHDDCNAWKSDDIMKVELTYVAKRNKLNYDVLNGLSFHKENEYV